MGTFNRFTPEEDYLILRDYWNPDRRKDVAEAMADRHTAKSVQFRYFQLLKLLNLGSAPTYRRMMEAYEKGEFKLPFDLEELVNKFHSGELKVERKKKTASQVIDDKEKPSIAEENIKKIAELVEAAKAESKEEPPAKPKEAVLAAKAEDEEYVDPLMPVLNEIQANIQELSRRVDQIAAVSGEKALSDLFVFLANATRHKEQIANLEAILEENKRLKEENEKLKEKYQEKIKEFDDIYQRLDEVWGHFMRLTSVKKAMSLEDFIDQLRFVIDRFGNVVDVTTREAGLRAAYRKASEATLR